MKKDLDKLSVIGGLFHLMMKFILRSLNKYGSHENINFLGSIPHKNLINEISDFSFHINNSEKGFYDKSVLETMSHGLLNFYSNSDYDDLIPEEYRNNFKFDGSPESLSNKITDIANLKIDEINKIINFSQSKLEKQSINNLVERVQSII